MHVQIIVQLQTTWVWLEHASSAKTILCYLCELQKIKKHCINLLDKTKYLQSKEILGFRVLRSIFFLEKEIILAAANKKYIYLYLSIRYFVLCMYLCTM